MQHDDLAKKLASDLLDEMKVGDDKKPGLLKELMAFVTAMEVAAIRGRNITIPTAESFLFCTGPLS